ncbi:MAG: leucine-rich repeat domain-containing protein, partial [Bacteroidaceae bacterium]|nr:leucine-rich repeat domain-containing protein [Bacteroidaceae bacterium]
MIFRTEITLPEWLEEIGNVAFCGCKNLKSITLPRWVKKIGDRSFRDCSSLTSISIPESVTEIGEAAFAWCPNLTSITVSKDNKVYDSREDSNTIIHTESNMLISGCKNSIIPPSVTEIGEYAFSGCSSLTSITVSKDNKV